MCINRYRLVHIRLALQTSLLNFTLTKILIPMQNANRMPENYKSKLQHPEWQKKRLEILQRDDFKCTLCHDTQTTLHVHHLIYRGENPWDVPDAFLITVCEACHEAEHTDMDKIIQDAVGSLSVKRYSRTVLNNLSLIIDFGLRSTGESTPARQIRAIIEAENEWHFNRANKA